MNLNVGKENRR